MLLVIVGNIRVSISESFNWAGRVAQVVKVPAWQA
jgi:hypothetical protein